MFTLRETAWQLLRNKGRTVILLLASAMLAGCMAFYLGNIRANEEAIDRLAQVTTVRVDVTNSTGEMSAGLNIATIQFDNFVASEYLEHFLYGARAAGAYSGKARREEPFTGGDADIAAINSRDAIFSDDYVFTFMEGYDEGIFTGDQPVCLVDELFAEENGIAVGDQLTFPIYLHIYEQGGAVRYDPLGDMTLTVVGTNHSTAYPKTFLVPVDWLRKEADARGVKFYYNTLSGDLKDPRRLNHFKAGIYDMAFLEPNPEAQDQFGGATIVVDDEPYITATEPLGQNILLFRQFLAPFFVLVIGLVVLAIFLIMRGARRDMAIACSLGRPRLLSALANFLAAFAAQLAGCLLVLPAMVLGAGLSLGGGLLICGAFLLCACLGNCLALALVLRFDPLALLTASE